VAVGSYIFNKVFNKIGSMYDYYIGSSSYNEYGDQSITWTAHSGMGYIKVTSFDDEAVKQGYLRVGDAVGYFRDDNKLVTGSLFKVNHQGTEFNGYGEPITAMISGNKLYKKISLRKNI
jgi:hypothetical protein